MVWSRNISYSVLIAGESRKHVFAKGMAVDKGGDIEGTEAGRFILFRTKRDASTSGLFNTANNIGAVIVGGGCHVASGFDSFVGGGYTNTAAGD